MGCAPSLGWLLGEVTLARDNISWIAISLEMIVTWLKPDYFVPASTMEHRNYSTTHAFQIVKGKGVILLFNIKLISDTWLTLKLHGYSNWCWSRFYPGDTHDNNYAKVT